MTQPAARPPGWWNETAMAWWPDWKPVLTDPFNPLCILTHRVADALRREAIAAARPKRVAAVPVRQASESAHV